MFLSLNFLSSPQSFLGNKQTNVLFVRKIIIIKSSNLDKMKVTQIATCYQIIQMRAKDLRNHGGL